jgi:adenylate cyclase
MQNQLRLWSGLILLLFVVGHMVNLSLGLISLQVMNDAAEYLLIPWRSWSGTVILTGAALVHGGLGLFSLFRLGRIGWRDYRSIQLILGLTIPFMLCMHVIGTRMLYEVFSFAGDFTIELLIFFFFFPVFGVLQALLVVVVWLHGWLGLTNWLKLQPGYDKSRTAWAAFGLLVPTLALSAYLSVGLQVRALGADEAWLNATLQKAEFDPSYVAWVFSWQERVLWITVAIIVAVLVARFATAWFGRSRHGGRLTYLGDKTLRLDIKNDNTVLELVQNAGQVHASACGGRGRCSTCRVRILTGADQIPAPASQEVRVLDRIAAPADVRLACQLRPLGDISVAPLMPPAVAAANILADMRRLDGREAQIAVLFADIRDFTGLSDQRLPYDTVFMLNRYFAAMGRAIENSGGHIDKFIGDGVMALFDSSDGGNNSRAALSAARAMADELTAFNQELTAELGEPLRIGIGIHFGTAVVGRMGYGDAAQVTAIGDTVNVASRLEALTKEHGAQLVVSEETLLNAGLNLSEAAAQEVNVRGVKEPVAVRIVADARKIVVD